MCLIVSTILMFELLIIPAYQCVTTFCHAPGDHCQIKNFYRPQRSWGKVIFSQASVILLTGVCFLLGGGVLPPGGVSAPGGGLAGGGPPGRLLLRAVRILLECILVLFMFSRTSISFSKCVVCMIYRPVLAKS